MPYHVRRNDREISNQSELNRIIAHNKYATLALCVNNEPYIVTLTYGYDLDNNTLYFHSGKNGLKIDFIKKNPYTCLTIIEDYGFDSKTCNHPYRSIVIRGEIEIVNDNLHALKALSLMVSQLDSEKIHDKVIPNDQFNKDILIFKVNIKEITGKEKK